MQVQSIHKQLSTTTSGPHHDHHHHPVFVPRMFLYRIRTVNTLTIAIIIINGGSLVMPVYTIMNEVYIGRSSYTMLTIRELGY